MTAEGLVARLTRIRRSDPDAVQRALAGRQRRPLLSGRSSLFIVAADHMARGVLKAGDDPLALGDRGELLRRLVVALDRPGVDGLLGTPDVVEDLALLGSLDRKVVFGSMNRGGLAGSSFELDDRFTAYDVVGLARDGLDGGKMMVRIALEEAASLDTLCACADAINLLAEQRLPAMIEVFASRREGGRIVNTEDPVALAQAISIVAGLGRTSAYTWLKLPVLADMEPVLKATTLPVLLLGGDPGEGASETFRRWEAAMAFPQVFGLVAGRALLNPSDGDVAGAVDRAAAIVARLDERRG